MTEQPIDSRRALAAAWGQTSGTDFASRLARRSLEASAQQDPDLAVLVQRLRTRGQAELDLHLEAIDLPEHSAQAAKFADFIAGMADAVKEIAKGWSHRKRWTSTLLVQAPQPGSFRVVLTVPPEKATQTVFDLEELEGQTQESIALQLVSSVLNAAESQNFADGESTLPGLTSTVPAAALRGVRRVARSVSEAGWTIQGEVRPPGEKPVPVSISRSGADAILALLTDMQEERAVETYVGTLDGHRLSTFTMWLAASGRNPMEVVVPDEFMREVTRLSADPDQEVVARLEVITTHPARTEGRTTRSYVLQWIAASPRLTDA